MRKPWPVAIALALAAGLATIAAPLHAQDGATDAAEIPARAERIDDARRNAEALESRLGERHQDVVDALVRWGTALRGQGRYGEALRVYERALRIAERLHGTQAVPLTRVLNPMAIAARNMGDYGRTEALRERALAILDAAQPPQPRLLATHSNNLAVLYRHVGQYARAEALYRRAIGLLEDLGNPDSRSLQLYRSNLATLHRLSGRLEDAEALLREVVAASVADSPTSTFTAYRMRWLADVLLARGRLEEADALLSRAREILAARLAPRHPIVVDLMTRQAAVHERRGETARALAELREAVSLLELSEAGQRRFDAQRDLAMLLGRQPGTRAEAIFVGKLAINTFQRIREQAEDLDEDSQRSLLENQHAIYQQVGEWLVEAGRLAEAEEVMQLLKQRELQDFTRRGGAGPGEAGMTGPEVALAREHAALGDQAVRAARELEALNLQMRGGRALDSAQQARRQELQTTLEQQRARLQAFFSDLQASLSSDQRAAQSSRDQAERGARQMQTLLRRAGPGHAGLQYVMTDERLSIILSLPEVSIARQVAVPRAEVNRQLAALRQALRSPSGDARAPAQALYKALIAPVSAELAAAGVHTLVLSLTDTLRYLPFSALHDGNGWLVQRFALAMHTPAAGQSLQPSQPARWQVAGLGLTRAVTVAEDNRAFDALPAVAQELRRVVRSGDSPDGTLPGTIALDGDFTRQRLESVLAGYPVLHIASHFQFAPGNEYGSYLVLGDGSRLPLADMKELDFTGVDLLTLSACETASGGGRNERGTEVEGLAAAVQLAGARAVLATLWPVADASTAQLMQRFYEGKARTGRNGAQALREAQLALLSGAVAGAADVERGARSTAASQPARAGTFEHPFFWAPFVLMGNWL